ncbi:MAG TPA: PIN domain-containing protein [Candidatus Acidoferrales bacterium]|nr:PIN domain-containing protein [Candidatus Acidoferrales bacterium]
MSDKTFVDTNVLVYAHDVDHRSKHDIAKTTLQGLWNSATGVLSPQVLQEFYVTVTHKIAVPLKREAARSIVTAYGVWCIDITPADVSAAFLIEDEARIGFWDALIVASAVKAGATTLLSEDLNEGQIIAGVRIENPFAQSAC